MRLSYLSKILAFGCVLLSASASQGGIIYDISLATSPLIGHPAGPFSLAFQFNDGSGAGDSNNTLTLSAFQFGIGGSAVGSATLFGGASGSLGSGITLTDSGFFNAVTQEFIPGSLLSFRLQTSTNLDAGGAPDEFSFSILDSTGTELPTTGFFDVFAVLDIDSANPVPQTFDSDSDRSGITMAAPQAAFVATPEPASWVLLGIGLASACCYRRSRQN